MGGAEMLIEEMEARMKAAVPELIPVYSCPEKGEFAVHQSRPTIWTGAERGPVEPLPRRKAAHRSPRRSRNRTGR